jgi:hypothetical protein
MRENKLRKWLYDLSKPPNLIALFVFLATFLLFLATLALYCATRALVAETKTASEQQLRAYIQASPGEIYNLKSGAKLEAYIRIINNGQTPGNDVRRWAAIKISKPLTVDAITELGRGDREEGELVSMPRQRHDIIRPLGAPTEAEAEAIIHGDQRIYVFGHIEYVDIFKQPRMSQFCFMYYGEVQDWPQNGGPGYDNTQARYCEHQNSAN